jgi:hypothetical protein
VLLNPSSGVSWLSEEPIFFFLKSKSCTNRLNLQLGSEVFFDWVYYEGWESWWRKGMNGTCNCKGCLCLCAIKPPGLCPLF